MSIVLRRDPKNLIPDFIDWFEDPFLTLRPFLGQPIRIENYTEDGHYIVRAEIAGIDPEKELEVSVEAGNLSIRVERSGQAGGKYRSEFRYGSYSRTLALPPGADIDNVTAGYANGILTIKIPVEDEQQEAVKTIPVTVGKE